MKLGRLPKEVSGSGAAIVGRPLRLPNAGEAPALQSSAAIRKRFSAIAPLRASRPLSAVATAPLVAMFCGLGLATAPLFSRVAGWALAAFVVACVTRLHLNRRAARLPSLALKVVLFGASAGAIAMTYGTMLGIEPGLTILLVLVALKVVETNGERDFQVLALLGYFLCLCALFFSQDLLLWLYVGLVFALLSAAVIRFHSGAGGAWRPIRTALALTLQAAPIVALLFVFFPRTSSGFRFQFSRSLLGTAGMSDRLSPGSVASLALNEDIAFRVEFPDGNTPPISQMYWRGPVLWRGDGLTWIAGPPLPLERRTGQLGGPAIRQQISLQPHGGRWIFALDRPLGDSPRFEIQPGGFLLNARPVFSTLHYPIVSRPDNHELTLPIEQMRAALAAPPLAPSPRVAALIREWKTDAANGREIVDRALRHFHVEKFSYSLNPGSYGENALDEFLFERRIGFCEHYAAAFATLMRLAGLPARVVLGYHGGELNRLGKYVIVRQSDAHAWAEVWLQGAGWQRVDPTEVIAPDRISSGLASYLQTRGNALDPSAAGDSDAARGWRDLTRELNLAWDNINYQWELRVLNFDEDNQRAFLVQLGFAAIQWIPLAFITLTAIAGVLALISAWLRRPGRPRRDEAGRAWAEFCRRLAAAGVRREPWEGPRHFGDRAAAQLAPSRDGILRVTDLYSRIRYSPAPPAPRELLDAVRGLELKKK